MFTHDYKNLNGIQLLNISHRDGVGMSIIPSQGGRLFDLTLEVEGKPIPILMPVTPYDNLEQNPYFLSSALIPFPNRLRGGSYSYAGEKLSFPVNSPDDGTALHGLVYNKPFTVKSIQSGIDQATCTLEYKYSGTDAAYPFPFTVQIAYTIRDMNTLECRTRIINTGDSPLPMGSGWHHYLHFPEGVDAVEMKLPPAQRVVVDSSLLPTGELMDFENFSDFHPMKDERFDTCFKLEQSDTEYYIELRDKKRKLHYTISMQGGNSGYKYFQLFNHPHGTGFAVEPMSCNIDAFNNGQGLIDLSAGTAVNYDFQINLDSTDSIL